MDTNKKTNWLIKHKSPIGQQLETVWNKETDKFIKQTNFGKPSFCATKQEARKILAEKKSEFRQYKWVRLYEIG